jgi:hypothetical protein
MYRPSTLPYLRTRCCQSPRYAVQLGLGASTDWYDREGADDNSLIAGSPNWLPAAGSGKIDEQKVNIPRIPCLTAPARDGPAGDENHRSPANMLSISRLEGNAFCLLWPPAAPSGELGHPVVLAQGGDKLASAGQGYRYNVSVQVLYLRVGPVNYPGYNNT